MNIPVLEALLQPLARRESWEFELWRDGDNKPFAKRSLQEVKQEFHDMAVGESRRLRDEFVIRRV